MIGTTRQKHIEKMPGCRVSRHPGISSQIIDQAASAQYSVRFALPLVDPANLPDSIHWMIFNVRRVSRNATPFRDWTRIRTTDHRAENSSFFLIIAHIYLMSVCEFLLHSCHPVDILE